VPKASWTAAARRRLGVTPLAYAELGVSADCQRIRHKDEEKGGVERPQCGPESAFSRKGESPLQVNVTCNRLQLRRCEAGWGAAGGERPVRKKSLQ